MRVTSSDGRGGERVEGVRAVGVRLVGGVLLEVDGRERRVGGSAASSGGRGRGSGACELSMGKPLERR